MGWVRQARDKVDEFEHRTRPAVRQQQWHWRNALTGYVQEMEVDPVQRNPELREGIQRCLLRSPNKSALPICEQSAQVLYVATEGPDWIGSLIRQARARESVVKVCDGLVCHLEHECLRFGSHRISSADG